MSAKSPNITPSRLPSRRVLALLAIVDDLAASYTRMFAEIWGQILGGCLQADEGFEFVDYLVIEILDNRL